LSFVLLGEVCIYLILYELAFIFLFLLLLLLDMLLLAAQKENFCGG